MDAKPSRVSQKVASKTSVMYQRPSQTKKIASEVSLTPSQAAEAGKNKNPLDALSRTNMRSTAAERRSGLQDVNEEYLRASSLFAKPYYAKHSGLNETYQPARTPVQQVMSQPANPGQPQVQQVPVTPTESAMKVNESAVPTPSQAQIQQQQQQAPVAMQGQQQQGQQAAYAQPQPTAQQQMPAAGQPSQNYKTQPIAQPPAQAQQQQQSQLQQQVPHVQYHHTGGQQQHGLQHLQQADGPQQGAQQQAKAQSQGGAAAPQSPRAGGGEPELCTTCPNCQTTIFLSMPSPREMTNRGQEQQAANVN